MDFKYIDKKYRPVPFWSWNEKLETEETKRQVRIMDEAGMGGYFMHARGGLQTEYLGEEWFENVSATIEEGKKRGMYSWAYDENGWPSGFGAGIVNGMGVEYQQKYLRMEDTLEHKDTHICEVDGKCFYYDINPFYVDTLDAKVIAEFIKVAYQPYYERYGNEFEGYFTDEPQISRDGIPWSFVFKDEYKARYNEDIYERLPELFLEINDYKTTRVRFWKMVTELFSENFMKQIYDWCDERGLKLTGHLVCENTFESQLMSNGACMPHYEYFHIPGMDWLGRNIHKDLTTMQLSSVAEQLGKEFVLSETFALCGHNVSFAELKGIYEWQLVHGINLLCQHLEGYSNRGIRKRDYPPAMYYQQPWWEDYRRFNDAMSRVGMILSQGKKKAELLVLHPQTTAWTMYNAANSDKLDALYDDAEALMAKLDAKHISWHFGDEIIMERHGSVKDGKLIIGNQEYSTVLDPGCEYLTDNTKMLLEQFKAQGGKLVTLDELEYNDVTDSEKLTYKMVEYPDFKVHYFVNTSAEGFGANFKVQGKVMDIYTGDLYDFDGTHEFEPWGSLLIIDDGTPNVIPEEKKVNVIKPSGVHKVVGKVENALTLDKCDYYFDGELQEKNGYVLNISSRANNLERKVHIHQDYKVNFNYVPEEIDLACETPWIFDITVNGNKVEYTDGGYFRDISFKKIDISKYVKLGENIISFECDFEQSPEVYENIRKGYCFESEKNKLYFDMEIEAVYLVGDFAVGTNGEWQKLGVVPGFEKNGSYQNSNAYRYIGEFTIESPVKEIDVKNMQMQGLPFFSGKLTLEGEVKVEEDCNIIELDMYGVNTVHVKIDGKEFVAMTNNKVVLDGVGSGVHKVEYTLLNNLRNLLGPHHLEGGESLGVSPAVFYKEKCVFNYKHDPKVVSINDNYCFVEMKI
ncbi:MAG: hypothetical protein IKV86_05515 [Clostridia bacterium]|nr:hypothetical protein [Clostridia bacterium]